MAGESASNDDAMSTFTARASPRFSAGTQSPQIRKGINPSMPGGRRSRSGLVGNAALLYVFATPLDVIPLPFGSPASIAGLLFLFSWAVALLRGEVRIRQGGLLVVLGALVTWSFATVAWSYAPSVSISQSVSTLLLAVSAVAISGVFRGSVVRPASVLAFGSVIAGFAVIVSGPDTTSGSEQATFFGIDQNVLAFHVSLGLAAALFVLLRVREPRLRAPLLLIVSIQCTSLMVAGSRTGIGSGIALAVAFLIISMGSLRRALRATRLLALVALVVWWLTVRGLVPSRVFEWLDNPTATDSRSQIIEAFRWTQDEWVLRGIGTGADADYLLATTSTYLNAHSAFWKVWIELGVVGLLLWGLLLAGLAIRAWRSPDRLFFVASAIPILFYFYTLGPLNSNALWVVFGLAMGSAAPRAEATSSSGADSNGSRYRTTF